MKNEVSEALEELVDLALRDAAARQVYKRRDVIAAALESEPLAVVEGWVAPQVVEENFESLLDLDYLWESLPPGRKDEGFVAVRLVFYERKPDDS